MSAIPFGIVGAVLGHALHDFDLSIMSVMGLVAMTGVVVNDSLVLVDAANGYSAEGHSMHRAVCLAGIRRFRPIVLNSLTTFFGLIPMINQPSPQAKFLIPMALSLGYGVLFSTFTTLVLVPAFTLIVEDGRRFVRWLYPKRPDRNDLVTASTSPEPALAEAASAREP
jgi:multidrug efflux pump subunit AcrB